MSAAIDRCIREIAGLAADIVKLVPPSHAHANRSVSAHVDGMAAGVDRAERTASELVPHLSARHDRTPTGGQPDSSDGHDRLASSGERHRVGLQQVPAGRSYENYDDYAYEVARRYGINLRGVRIMWDADIRSDGVTRAKHGGWVIHVSPRFASEKNLANTIAHELHHARDYQKGIDSPHADAYAAGDALEEWIDGLR